MLSVVLRRQHALTGAVGWYAGSPLLAQPYVVAMICQCQDHRFESQVACTRFITPGSNTTNIQPPTHIHGAKIIVVACVPQRFYLI